MKRFERRERVNHGHDRWDGRQFVVDYQKWCAACRKALAEKAITESELRALDGNR